ncbi:MAG: MraY family glycosyltransferase [Myxococcota bacterium]
MEALLLLLPLAVAFGVACLATPFVARLANALHIVDRPSERTVSQRSGMPLLGGLAVGLGFAAGLAVALWLLDPVYSWRHLQGLMLGGALILATGVVDDRWGMSAWPKFALQFAAAAIAIAYGFQIGHITEPISRTSFALPIWLSWLVTSLWIVGVTNAINLVDGLDGLASGVAAIIGATLSFIAWQTGQPLAVCIGIALVGALLGFLPFNFPPARIFLGDTGSLLAGYLLALLALAGYRQVTLLTFVVPLLALAVPILDTAVSIVRRVRLGTPVFSADRLHLHHRLLVAEGSARGAVLQIYFLTGCFCLIAIAFTNLQGYGAALFLLVTAAVTLRLLWNLGVLSQEGGKGRSGELSARAEEKKS